MCVHCLSSSQWNAKQMYTTSTSDPQTSTTYSPSCFSLSGQRNGNEQSDLANMGKTARQEGGRNMGHKSEGAAQSKTTYWTSCEKLFEPIYKFWFVTAAVLTLSTCLVLTCICVCVCVCVYMHVIFETG
jgi:hypothetical protein